MRHDASPGRPLGHSAFLSTPSKERRPLQPPPTAHGNCFCWRLASFFIGRPGQADSNEGRCANVLTTSWPDAGRLCWLPPAPAALLGRPPRPPLRMGTRLPPGAASGLAPKSNPATCPAQGQHWPAAPSPPVQQPPWRLFAIRIGAHPHCGGRFLKRFSPPARRPRYSFLPGSSQTPYAPQSAEQPRAFLALRLSITSCSWRTRLPSSFSFPLPCQRFGPSRRACRHPSGSVPGPANSAAEAWRRRARDRYRRRAAPPRLADLGTALRRRPGPGHQAVPICTQGPCRDGRLGRPHYGRFRFGPWMHGRLFGRSRCVRQHFPGGLPLPSPLFRPIPAAVCQGLLRPDIHLLLVGRRGHPPYHSPGRRMRVGGRVSAGLVRPRTACRLACCCHPTPARRNAGRVPRRPLYPHIARACAHLPRRRFPGRPRPFRHRGEPGQDPGLPPGRWPPTTRHQRPWPGCLVWRRAAARRVRLPCLGHPYRHACLCPSGLGRPRASPSRLPPRAPAPAWLASRLAPAHILRRAPGPASAPYCAPYSVCHGCGGARRGRLGDAGPAASRAGPHGLTSFLPDPGFPTSPIGRPRPLCSCTLSTRCLLGLMGWRVASPPTTRAGSCRAAYRHPLYRCCLRDNANVPPRSSRVRDTSRCPRLDRATSLGHPSLWSPRPAAPRRSRARPLSARLATTRSARPSYRTQSARSDAYPPRSWASSPPLPVGAPRCSMAHCHPDGSRDDLVARRNAGGLATPPPPPLAPSLAPLRRRQGVWLRRPLGPLRGPRNRLPSHRPASPPCETRRAGLAPGCAWSGRGWRPRHRPATPGGYEHTGRVLLRSTPIGHRHLWGWPPRGGALRGRHPGCAFESARAAYSRLCHPGRRGPGGRRASQAPGLPGIAAWGATTPPCPRRRNGGAMEPRLLLPHAHLADCPIAPHAVPRAPGHVLWVAAALVGAPRLCGAACRGDERHLGAMGFHAPYACHTPLPLGHPLSGWLRGPQPPRLPCVARPLPSDARLELCS